MGEPLFSCDAVNLYAQKKCPIPSKKTHEHRSSSLGRPLDLDKPAPQLHFRPFRGAGVGGGGLAQPWPGRARARDSRSPGRPLFRLKGWLLSVVGLGCGYRPTGEKGWEKPRRSSLLGARSIPRAHVNLNLLFFFNPHIISYPINTIHILIR